MKRRKRLPWWRRAWAWLTKQLAVDDPVRRHRSDGAKRGWATRKRNATPRNAKSDPTP